jgi:branched-chain amino acid transport system ATP-binding protein
VSALIEARGLCVGYGGAAAVRDLDLEVHPGEIVALLGANGAGKTTTLLALAGVLPPTDGEVVWEGRPVRSQLHQRARDGLALVTEERSVFTRLTTRQNLAVAHGCDLAKAVQLFPALDDLMDRRGGLLSGGEQQMLTLARALAREPKLLLADEMSLGLAPKTVGALLTAVRQAADAGIGALVVEQHVHRVLTVADRVYVLRRGEITFSGTAATARERLADIESEYLSHRTTASAEAMF